MEGVSHEAASLAGHQKLGRLIVIFDDNQITIDGGTNLSCSDDVALRFSSYGWSVSNLGAIGDDLDALESALTAARDSNDDRPKLLILRTQVGFPSPDWTGKHEAHGNPFNAEHVTRTKQTMNIPDEPFWAPMDVVAGCRESAKVHGAQQRLAWEARLEASPLKQEWTAAWNGGLSDWQEALPNFALGESIATRVAVQKVFDAVLPKQPGLVSGSADLTGNTGTKLSGQTPMSAENPQGRQVYYGVREHAMGSAMVGMALHGGVYPIGGTFFVFFDYMKPPIRLAALSKAKCLFVFSHDSVGVGEDGPTHQPIEHLAALRAIPDLQVIRPCDANETAQAVRCAFEHDGPTALILSRQNLPVLTDGSAVAHGAGIVRQPAGKADVIIVATGSELHVALQAADDLLAMGIDAQVVSLPSWDRFAAFRDKNPVEANKILPGDVETVSVEAGATFGWQLFADSCVGIDRFGASAPGSEALDRLGINPLNVVSAVKKLLQR
jgi:transketolase